jgi:regulator of replication initiation timing
MNETTGKRIAFVVNARTGDELQAGNRDSSRLWTLLTDPNLGRCEPIYPPLHNCENEFSFLKELKEILKKLNSSDQLLFYFSGHGIVKNQQYCIKLGLDEDSYYPFKNLINQLRVSGIERAIIIIDACHSGKILSEIGTKKNEFNPLENLELELPKGIAIIASCQESQKSYELPDSSSSVFTHLLCQAIEGGLDGQATPNSLISISDVIGYIQKQLETNKIYKSYPQKPIFTINGANQDIWIAKNKSGLQEIDNNIVHNSKIISSAFQNLLVEQLQSIKKEIITDVKLTSLDETTQNTLKDLSDKVSNIQAIVGSLSIGKEGGSISQYQEKVEQLEIKIKEYEGQEERHFTRIRELNDERNRLSQNLAEQRQQIEQFSSGEVEQLRKENQRLSSSYQNLETRLCNVKIEKAQLEQQATTLNSQVNQLQQDKKALELKVQTNVQDIEALKKEIERLRKLLNKEAIETGDIPRQWQNIINSYNQSPDAILNIHGVHKQGEVVEDEDKGAERRNNSSKPVVLTSNVSPDGFYIVLVGNDYLLFPKQHAIAASQKFTVSALFDGYRSGNTSKFTLISPAQVTPVGSSGMWQLKHKGKLEYN